ncbi:MAG TPA: hypothetical protein ACFYDZ_01465 [Candidatus Brocadiaceae bacterium]
MKPVNFNIKSLEIVFETIGKRIIRWKYYLPIINLILFFSVIGFAVICILLIYNPPEQMPRLSRHEESPLDVKSLPSLSTDAKPLDAYDLIMLNNPFSSTRTPWTSLETPVAASKTEAKTDVGQEEGEGEGEDSEQSPVSQQKHAGSGPKIALQGILIFGSNKKALIENPDRSKSDKQFIFVEEGEDIGGYKVKSIEPDQVKLDWHGEELILVMRSTQNK